MNLKLKNFRLIKFKIILGILYILNLSIPNNLKAEDILYISAIPDQNPERLNRMYELLSSELSEKLNTQVKYKPVVNYAAAVTAFRTGNLDLVWFGGLTGVQARINTKNAKVIAQRNIDEKFRSFFIANKKSSLQEIYNINDLASLKNKRFTFGSESSTSGRLIPQYYLNKAGVQLKDFKGGSPGFSGSHDTTLILVESGAYDAGVLNAQVWSSNLDRGRINTSKVFVIWETPPFFDYHWLAQGNLDKRFGKGFTKKLTKTFLDFDYDNPKHKKILDLFGAKSFIASKNENYNKIEKIARDIGKIK
mgnify:CR=1 FL=1|tara:strand:- start:200 stop:1117 length:918 start_codon:yes stop_codon:yes gene_type:complete